MKNKIITGLCMLLVLTGCTMFNKKDNPFSVKGTTYIDYPIVYRVSQTFDSNIVANASISSPTITTINNNITTADSNISDSSVDIGRNENNILANAFRISVNGALAVFDLDDGFVDQFEDQSGIDLSTGSNYTYDASGDYYSYNILSSADFSTSIEYQLKMNDNASTTNIIDSSGTGNTAGSKNNTDTMSVVGKINNALEFNGSTDYLTLQQIDSTWLAGIDTTDYTISFWIAPDDWTPGADQGIFGCRESGDGYPAFVAFTWTASGTKWRVWHGSDNVKYNEWIVAAPNGYVNGSWHHIVTVWTATTKWMDIYLDGVKATVTTNSNGVLNTMDNWTGELPRVGAIEQSSTINSYFAGKLDDFRIWTGRKLTSDEIVVLYNGGSGTEETSLEFGGNMELISTNIFGADAIPTNARAMILHENVTGTATANTDFKVWASSDQGSTWDQILVTSLGELSSGITMYAGTNTLTGNDTNMTIRFTTHDNTKAGRIHGWAELWKE